MSDNLAIVRFGVMLTLMRVGLTQRCAGNDWVFIRVKYSIRVHITAIQGSTLCEMKSYPAKPLTGNWRAFHFGSVLSPRSLWLCEGIHMKRKGQRKPQSSRPLCIQLRNCTTLSVDGLFHLLWIPPTVLSLCSPRLAARASYLHMIGWWWWWW